MQRNVLDLTAYKLLQHLPSILIILFIFIIYYCFNIWHIARPHLIERRSRAAKYNNRKHRLNKTKKKNKLKKKSIVKNYYNKQQQLLH